MKKIALFPGSFDPFTLGHEELVKRGLKVFDHIVIAVGVNSGKKEFMKLKNRVSFIQRVFSGYSNVSVEIYDGLTVEYCHKVGASVLLRGLRTAADFEYERAIGQANRAMDESIDTMLMLTSARNTFISSSIVRNIYENGGNVDQFLPSTVNTEILRELLNE